MDKLVFIKIKISCTANDTSKKVKRQPTKLEKVFANHICNKIFVPRLSTEHLQLIKQKIRNQILKSGQKFE